MVVGISTLELFLLDCRSQLKLDAECSSIDAFGDNLKGLLLQPPCKGEILLGVDPGFTNGCKLAVISKYGKKLLYSQIFFYFPGRFFEIFMTKLALQYNVCSHLTLGYETTHALPAKGLKTCSFSEQSEMKNHQWIILCVLLH